MWQALTHRGHRWQVDSQTRGVTARMIDRGRLPGAATLTVDVTPREDGRTYYTQTATFCPRGLPGRLYAISLWQVRRKLLRRSLFS